MRIWLVVTWLLMVSVAQAAQAKAEYKCAVCGRLGEEGEQVFNLDDPVDRIVKYVCSRCRDVKPNCFICRIPLPENARELGDGRMLCPRDGQLAVVDAEAVKEIAEEGRRAAERSLSRFMAFPAAEVVLEDEKAMGTALSGRPRQCGYPFFRVTSEQLAGGKLRHQIGLLSGLPRSWLVLGTVHALGHVWLAENVPAARKLAPPAVEGFCELVAWRSAEELGLGPERVRLEGSRLTDDQMPLLLEADRTYDFHAVAEWMLYGQGNRLVAGESDRVRRLDEKLQPVRKPEAPALPTAVAPPAPRDRFVLNGIVGTGQRRLALVNEATLAQGEKGRIRIGAGVIEVECLEIRAESVILLIPSTGDKVELKLKTSK